MKKTDPNRNFDLKVNCHKLPMFFGVPFKIHDFSPCIVQRSVSQDLCGRKEFTHVLSDAHYRFFSGIFNTTHLASKSFTMLRLLKGI